MKKRSAILTLLVISILMISFVNLVSANVLTDVLNKITGKVVDNETATCTDSDGGLNYNVKGEFSGNWGGEFITNTDSCLTSLDETGDDVYSSQYLGEGYCENGILKVKRITCPNGCVNGVCMEQVPEEPETCAASININFNQDVYHEGDFFKLTIEVFDSQGNRIPNYPFYIGASSSSGDEQEFDTDTGTTNEQGYVEQIDSELRIVESVKVLYRVYTQETSSCPSVEDSAEIEAIKEETEEDSRPEPEPAPSTGESGTAPTTCAAKIKVTFDKEIYYIGDTAKIVIEVLDSQGNHLPDYDFYNQVYDTMWHTPGSERTGSDGYFRAQPTVEKEQSTLGKMKFKVYTAKYSNCNSVEDIATIEIRTRERPEPIPCGIGTCIPEESPEEPTEIPEDKVFYKCSGCELEGKCYPMGYRKEGKYCSDNNEFTIQIKGTCDNNFECKSNVCISGECIGEGLIKRIIKWFKKLFGNDENEGEEDSGLKMCSKLLIEKNIGDNEYTESAYGHQDHQVAVYSEDGEQIDIVKCCLAVYGEEGEGGVAVLCPFDNRKDVENALYWLSNKEELTLEEYKGQKVYGAGNAIIWTHEDFIVASGTNPETPVPLPEEIINAYLKKYPNDLGEIEIPEVGGLPSNFESLSPKEQVELIHMQNLEYFIAGDAKRLAAAYSSDYLDTGGGPEGTGKVQLDEAYFKEYFSSERFDELSKDINGRPINELLDLDKKIIYSYEEFVRGTIVNVNRVQVEYMKGDILVGFPPKEGSPLFDGWSAVYRKENNVWKIIAGD